MKWVIAVIFMFILNTHLFGATVYLKDGTVFQATILNEEKDYYLVDSVAGEMRVAKSKIDKIEHSELVREKVSYQEVKTKKIAELNNMLKKKVFKIEHNIPLIQTYSSVLSLEERTELYHKYKMDNVWMMTFLNLLFGAGSLITGNLSGFILLGGLEILSITAFIYLSEQPIIGILPLVLFLPLCYILPRNYQYKHNKPLKKALMLSWNTYYQPLSYAHTPPEFNQRTSFSLSFVIAEF